MLNSILCLSTLLIFRVTAVSMPGRCLEPLHRGIDECTNSSTIRYWMDGSTEHCLAFNYTGCGGNRNNFETYRQCRNCLPLDYISCPLASGKIKSSDGSVTCGKRKRRGARDPEPEHVCDGPNSYCAQGAFFGVCCDKSIREKLNNDYEPTIDCGPNRQKYQVQERDYNIVIMSKLIILLYFVGFSLSIDFRDECTLPIHFGLTDCNNQSSIRYHLNPATADCLAFKYSGCGGNANNFETQADCQMNCIPMDYFKCPGDSKVVPNKDKTSYCTAEKECDGPNSYCSMGAFSGLCCDNAARDKSNQDYADECGPNQTKYKVDRGGYESILFGKTCDSNFCPDGYQCQQGNYYAYCCK
ncbi:unnamed protein product [Caenorhabditis bovis]|uniref:BPTI/Kunitz inhibitor domain-containing protein n=1 Tax=Caenorhabditis bovis TaxID=2654633 RepID=A0A8S1E3S4_9PELO|nr:unnamed protein product [Caenorhabditis bovis]